MANLDEAVQNAEDALEATPCESWERQEKLNDLGVALGDRYRKLKSITDLHRAIEITREAMETKSEDDGDTRQCTSNLGYLIWHKYSESNNKTDLDEAVKYMRQAFDDTPIDDFEKMIYGRNLSDLLCDRYLRTGAVEDLDEAIQLLTEAVKEVDIVASSHPDRQILEWWRSWRNDLSLQLGHRYKRTGALADLQEACEVARTAAIGTSDNGKKRGLYLSNLSIRLGELYSRSQAKSDLDEAVQSAQQAVDVTPESDPFRASYRNNLGNRLKDRFERLGEKDDLERAIVNMRFAVNSNLSSQAEKAEFRNNLGIFLTKRYTTAGGAQSDIAEAIKNLQDAIDLTPMDHPKRARYLNNMGIGLHARFRLSETKPKPAVDIEKALQFHQMALKQNEGLAFDRIIAARLIIRSSKIVSDWQQAYQASKMALTLLPVLVQRFVENSDKQHLLSQIAGLASDSAAAALRAGNNALEALGFLEEGRGALASSLEDLRTDMKQLRETYPELAGQFESLREELKAPTNQMNTSSTRSDRRYEAAKLFDDLVAVIRKKSEFTDFLRAPNEEQLKGAASDGPVIIINVSKYGCDAILVQSHRIWPLALPELEYGKIKEKAIAGEIGDPETLEWLWDKAIHPILTALEIFHAPVDDNWRHVWWIPTGYLSKFPIHAAGYHTRKSGATVLDRVMSSYSSSIKAIIHGRRRPLSLSIPRQALLVSMEFTPQNARLHFAPEEVEKVRKICKSMAFMPIEPGRRKKDITSSLLDSKIFHFAGHGCTDNFDPSKSHLQLEDWKTDPLKVADLLNMDIRERLPFLAYLSACGTGRIKDEKFFDENLHLINAFQLLGFRHVIGTLWEVNDKLCVDMATITYQELEQSGLADGSVCRGLHNATRELRARWLTGSNAVVSVENESRQEESFIAATRVAEQEDIVDYDSDTGQVRHLLPCDDDSDDGSDYVQPKKPPQWVPYVHFGV